MTAMMLNAGNSLHQRIIGALPTREWQVDSHPLDNVWYISTQREGERSEPETVRFDVPIGAWPNTSSLDDVRHINDLITAKILVWYSLEPAPIGWLRTASSVPGFHRTNLNFLRCDLPLNCHPAAIRASAISVTL